MLKIYYQRCIDQDIWWIPHSSSDKYYRSWLICRGDWQHCIYWCCCWRSILDSIRSKHRLCNSCSWGLKVGLSELWIRYRHHWWLCNRQNIDCRYKSRYNFCIEGRFGCTLMKLSLKGLDDKRLNIFCKLQFEGHILNNQGLHYYSLLKLKMARHLDLTA